MRPLSYVALAFLLTSTFSFAVPQEVPAPVDTLFVPNVFDANDNVEVVLHGEFVSSCYGIGNVKIDKNLAEQLITVRPTAYFYTDAVCIQAITPFVRPVQLGVLPKGNYRVEVITENAQLAGNLPIAPNTVNENDPILYAPVDNAFLRRSSGGDKQQIVLQGTYPTFVNGCMEIVEVETTLEKDDVLLVEPKVEIIDNEICEKQSEEDRAFEVVTDLNQPFSGEGLLHVRALHGASLNRYLFVRPRL